MNLGFTPSINVASVGSGFARNPSSLIDWNISNPNNLYNTLLEEQEAYNKHIEDREDSSVQRWVEDVRKAGLNPWAFTGSGSSTTNVGSPHKIAFDSLLSYLNFDLNKTSKNAQNILGAVKIGAGLASSIFSALF